MGKCTEWPDLVCSEGELGSPGAELLTVLGNPSLRDTEFWDPLRARAVSWIGTPERWRVEAGPSLLPYCSTSSRDCTSANARDADGKMSPFLKLPNELRNQILGYLVPDLDVISNIFQPECDSRHCGGVFGGEFCLRKDHDSRHMKILRVNRQLYAEGSSIAYGRTFLVKIEWNAIDFLTYSLSFTRGLENTVGLFPFHMVRHLHVEIISTRRAAPAAVLLHNTICICRELSRAPEVQNLQISFVNNNWEGFRDDDSPKKSGWRQRASKSLERRRSGGNRPLPHSTDQWHSIDDDVEVALQPFGLLRNVKQCIINLPPLLEAEDGLIAAVRYLQEIMTSKSSADDSDCDEDLTRLWQSDVQQLLIPRR